MNPYPVSSYPPVTRPQGPNAVPLRQVPGTTTPLQAYPATYQVAQNTFGQMGQHPNSTAQIAPLTPAQQQRLMGQHPNSTAQVVNLTPAQQQHLAQTQRPFASRGGDLTPAQQRHMQANAVAIAPSTAQVTQSQAALQAQPGQLPAGWGMPVVREVPGSRRPGI